MLSHPTEAGLRFTVLPSGTAVMCLASGTDPRGTTVGTPVLFIHGLWLHATSWGPWQTRFRDDGYEPQAPGWPGDGETVEASRRHGEAIGDHGIDDVVAHFAAIIEQLPEAPILIGHSFGG